MYHPNQDNLVTGGRQSVDTDQGGPKHNMAYMATIVRAVL